MAHCKRAAAKLRVLVLVVLGISGATGISTATDTQGDGAPPLTLETLYHPEQKHDYDGELPEAKWITENDDGSRRARLIVRRDLTWMTFDPSTGQQSPWDLPQQLADKISALDSVTEKQVTSAVDRAIRSMESVDQAVLIRVGKSLAVVRTDRPAKWLTRDASTWNDVTLDPTQSRVAYTNEGDLFVVDVESGRSHRLTDDASPTLLDGRLDWMYQEEIFGRGNYKGFRFSPDGMWVAMLRIDTSRMQPYTLGDSLSDRGAGVVRRYSKAGDEIPHAALLLWDLRRIDQGHWPTPKLLAQSTPEAPQIITGMWWHPFSAKFVYSISNRRQTWREVRYVDEDYFSGRTSHQKRWLREDSPAWVEPPSDPTFLNDGGIIWQSNLPIGRSRLFRLRSGGKTVTPITPDDFDVREFFVSSDGSFAILSGGDNGDTSHQHVYLADLSAAGGSPPVLKKLTGGRGGWNTAMPSPDGRFLLIRHSDSNTPPRLTVRPRPKASGTDGHELTGERLIGTTRKSAPGGWIENEVFKIETPDGIRLPAILKKSPSASPIDPGPVLIEVYGGPGVPIVRDRWGGVKAMDHERLARQGISVLTVDNRSSGGRGIADTWAVRGKFGATELADLLSGVDRLKQQDWVDADRIAIRGWSFGGFLTLYGMVHSDAFVAGIAGGSVTDWREYDSFYTERYMGLPEENPQGYADHSLPSLAGRLTGRVLLIHGESDDNVHPSNTLRMAEALQKAGKPFDLMIYPGAAHGVTDPAQAWHLARTTDEFLRRYLTPRNAP